MTPREKAIQLVEQFASVLMHDEVYEDSIKCALIAVDEIYSNRTKIQCDKLYWKQVKHELEKL